jgi:hypothetical protein
LQPLIDLIVLISFSTLLENLKQWAALSSKNSVGKENEFVTGKYSKK